MSQVRVRFAPSPTGDFHIGSARTALFNWLYARHTSGVFILRIEDTDRERNTPEALRLLLDGMRWLGLNWDEGPEVGGEHGPYFQSERGDIYKEHLEKLREAGRAYDKDGAVWFKISGEPQVIEDAIRGRVERTEEKDFVIFRSNGAPVYHFTVVVDDIAMSITHVLRGEDHLSNTSKHTELFKAFGAPLPIFAHIPLILKSHGPGKMSKRDEGALIEEYHRRRFLPEAVRNYLCLLGWNPKDDSEVMSIDEIIERFDFPGINRNNARFDDKKLAHFNTEHLRLLPLETFTLMVRPDLDEAGVVPKDTDEDYMQAVLGLCQEKVRSFPELPDYIGYFFNDDFEYAEKAHKKVFRKGDPPARVRELLAALESLEDFSEVALEQTLQGLAEANGLYTGEYIHPARLAVSGTDAGPGLYALLRVLGKERTIRRLKRFVEKFG